MADDGYGKYRKMLKMGIPRQQVNASMLMDGKDSSKFSEQDPADAGPVGESGGLDLTMKGDQYDKYREFLPVRRSAHPMLTQKFQTTRKNAQMWVTNGSGVAGNGQGWS